MNSNMYEMIHIFLIYLIITYYDYVSNLSDTILGRFFSVFLIIFYSSLDKYFGLFVCGILICIHQSEFMGKMLNNCENFENYESRSFDFAKVDSDATHFFTTDETEEDHDDVLHELVKDQFREQYCINHKVILNDDEIKNEMIDVVFPKISFNGKHCNPCDKTCNFSIIERKLENEAIMKPVSSRDP